MQQQAVTFRKAVSREKKIAVIICQLASRSSKVFSLGKSTVMKLTSERRFLEYRIEIFKSSDNRRNSQYSFYSLNKYSKLKARLN